MEEMREGSRVKSRYGWGTVRRMKDGRLAVKVRLRCPACRGWRVAYLLPGRWPDELAHSFGGLLLADLSRRVVFCRRHEGGSEKGLWSKRRKR